MKANELRVGNYFIGYSNYLQQWELASFKLLAEGIEVDEIIKSYISLDEEWFNKLGMTYYSLPTKSNRSVGYYTVKYGNRFKINSSDGNYSFINFRKEIKYVHELQNLYFAVTGEELTYENEIK